MSDEIIQRQGYWYAKKRKYKEVTIPYQSLKTSDEQEARDRLLEIKLLIRQGVYQSHLTRFEQLVAKYNPQVDRVNKLRNLDNHLMPELKGKRVSEIDIQAWAEKICSKYPESTALHILRPAREMGFKIDYKALTLIPNKRFDGTQIVSEELALQVADTVCKKYKPLCMVALYSAMPLSDLIHLRKMDVTFAGEDAGIVYRRRKTRHKNKKQIIVPMTNKLREAFKLLPIPFKDEDCWFPQWNSSQVSRAVGRAFKQCGWVHGRATHNFRHSAACYLIRQGVDLIVIQELLGHSDFNTTLIYARLDRTKLNEGVRKFDAK